MNINCECAACNENCITECQCITDENTKSLLLENINAIQCLLNQKQLSIQENNTEYVIKIIALLNETKNLVDVFQYNLALYNL
jgi:hypothetical protein